MELKSPFDGDGLPSDQSVVQGLLNHIFDSSLVCNPQEHPVLLVEPSWNTAPVREGMAEYMFETYNTPGLFISKAAVLATFMNAKASALVLDVGHQWTSAVPVHDGYVLKKAIQRSPVAGARLGQDLLRYLQQDPNQPSVQPQYACERQNVDGALKVTVKSYPQTHPSYRAYMVEEVMRDLKESLCQVSGVDFDEEMYAKQPAQPYELPDGRVVQMGAQRFKTPELLFKPDLYEPVVGPLGEGGIKGAHELVCGAISAADGDLRKDLWNSVCLAGGTSLLAGFKERLERDLTNISPTKLKITASAFPVERKFSSWIGGSILGCLGTFQQMWISKSEYEENGSGIVERKCP
jgi:actin-like protein 6A